MSEWTEAEKAAARAYCEALGQDPDQRVTHGMPPDAQGRVKLLAVTSPRWMLALNEVRKAVAMRAALAVLDAPPAPQKQEEGE